MTSNSPQKSQNQKVTIQVEKLNPATFNQWTDGPKIVIDMMAAVTAAKDGTHVHIAVGSVEEAVATITNDHVSHCTFFIVGKVRDVFDIVNQSNGRDVRMLLV